MKPGFSKGFAIGTPIALALWALIAWGISSAFAQSGGTTTRPTWFNGATQSYISAASPLPVTTVTSGGSVTPSAPSGSLTLTLGGTAQNLFTAGEVVHGCTIQNPATATEKIKVNFFTTAVTTDGTTSIELTPGQSIGCGFGIATAVSWIAATTSHTINAIKF